MYIQAWHCSLSPRCCVPACPQAVTFDRVVNASGAVPDDHADFVERLTHLLSLLHALALQHLRGDWHLSNLVAHDPSIGPPPVV